MRSTTLALLSLLVIALFASPDMAFAAKKKKKRAPAAPVVATKVMSGEELVQRAEKFYDNGEFKRSMDDALRAEAVLENSKRTKESDALLATAKCIIADMLVMKHQGNDKSITLDMITAKIIEALRLDPGKANSETAFRHPDAKIFRDSALAKLYKESTENFNSAKAALSSATYCQQWKDIEKKIQFYPDKDLAKALIEETQNKCAAGPALGGNGLLFLPFVVRDKGGGETEIERILSPSFINSELRAAFKNTSIRVVSADKAAGYMKSLSIPDWKEFTISPWIRLEWDEPSSIVPSSYRNELPKQYRSKLQNIAQAEAANWVCVLKAESSKTQGQELEIDLQLDIFNQADPAKPVVSVSSRVMSATLVVDRFRQLLNTAASEFSRKR
jgi:hypothetical protein